MTISALKGLQKLARSIRTRLEKVSTPLELTGDLLALTADSWRSEEYLDTIMICYRVSSETCKSPTAAGS
jgi:hypothetical protein